VVDDVFGNRWLSWRRIFFLTPHDVPIVGVHLLRVKSELLVHCSNDRPWMNSLMGFSKFKLLLKCVCLKFNAIIYRVVAMFA
jgi:hypothetical protein